jgi:CheY-like chemotaxis protein
MIPSVPIDGRRACVLVVDDEADNREVLDLILAWEGFVIRTADGGAAALASVAQSPPDLILLDVMMPGMDGYEVATRIKADPATKHIPIVMVTALEDRTARARAMSAGADEFLKKPLDRGVLVSLVKALLIKSNADPRPSRASGDTNERAD